MLYCPAVSTSLFHPWDVACPREEAFLQSSARIQERKQSLVPLQIFHCTRDVSLAVATLSPQLGLLCLGKPQLSTVWGFVWQCTVLGSQKAFLGLHMRAGIKHGSMPTQALPAWSTTQISKTLHLHEGCVSVSTGIFRYVVISYKKDVLV